MGCTAYVGDRFFQTTLNAQGNANAIPGDGNPGVGFFFSAPGTGWSVNYGSISPEPFPGFVMNGIVQRSTNSLNFFVYGDVTALVSGLKPYIDGVAYPMASDWTYAVDANPLRSGTSWISTALGGPVLVAGNSYNIQFRR